MKAEGAEVVITKEMEEEEKLAMEEGERKEKAMMEQVWRQTCRISQQAREVFSGHAATHQPDCTAFLTTVETWLNVIVISLLLPV